MKRLLSISVSVSLALAGNAQTIKSKEAEARPYFIGLQTAGNWYEVYYPVFPTYTPPSRVVVRPVMVVAGYRVLPRVTVQAAFGYRYEYSESPGSVGVTSSGQKVLDDAFWQESRTWALPITLRYALLRRHSRLQVDVLAGMVWLHDSFTQEAHSELDGKVTQFFRVSNAAHNFCASAGLGVRYAFGRHFEGVADLAYNRNLHDADPIVHQYVTGNRWGLTRSLNFGLRYRFNLGKGKATAAGSAAGS